MLTSRISNFVTRLRSDVDFRVRASLYLSCFWNAAYAIFQLVLGVLHQTFWFTSFAIYYFLLTVMRLMWFKNRGERSNLRKYKICGWILLLLNLALSVIVFFMIYWNRTFYHYEITTITLATYTFVSLGFTIYGFIKYRKDKRLGISATRVINLASACVSMLILESTMLTVFDNGKMTESTSKLMIGLTGAAISVVLVALSIFMLVRARRDAK